MTRTQWICNLAVFPFVCIAIALFLAVDYVIGGPNHDSL